MELIRWSILTGKWKNVDAWSYVLKRIVYILCFAWLCYLDHIMGSAYGYIQFGRKHYFGVVIAIIILTAYKPKDFLKLPYFVWSAVFFIGRYFVMKWATGNYWNPLEVNSYLWNTWFGGIVTIRMLYRFMVERKRPSVKWSMFSLWLVMMTGMVIVRPDVIWPWLFLFFFGLFYVTDFTRKDINNLFVGMIEGILLGFILIQGYGLLHRPYDDIRYLGMYSNANVNALFYVFSYCAVLCKWYYMKLKRRPLFLRVAILIPAGVLVGMVCLTMCRTAIITMFFLTVLFLIFQMLSVRKWHRKIRECVVDSAALLVAIVLCFIPTYNMVRYIPAYVDDPVYFEADAAAREEGRKIEKGDPIDSDKYFDFKTVVNQMMNRMLWFHSVKFEDIVDERFLDWLVGFTVITEAADDDYSWVVRDEVYVEPGTDRDHPMMSNQDAALYPARIRLNIYKYYLDHMKPFGKRDGVDYVWVTDYYIAPHAHNNLLQIAGDFGWVFAALFCAIALCMVNTLLFGLEEKRSGASYYRFFVMGEFLLVLFVFGMLEVSCKYGQLPFTMFFVVQYLIYHRIEKDGE